MVFEKDESSLTVTDVVTLTKRVEEYRSMLLVMLQGRVDPAIGTPMAEEELIYEIFLLTGMFPGSDWVPCGEPCVR